MQKLFITGASGNVGISVLKALHTIKHQLSLVAGVQNIEKGQFALSNFDTQLILFDFTNISTYKNALAGIDILFLLRPPQISDTEKYFKPLIKVCVDVGVKHIVFLSVQGVQKSKMIPHYKIEKLIVDSNINYTFLRPAYFMQNFLTSLNKDLVKNKIIYLPAGNAKFTIVDVVDVGNVAAFVLTNINLHINKKYELTNNEKLTFAEMVKILSIKLNVYIHYKSPSILSFFVKKKIEKMPTMLVLVMIMLHFLPRFRKEPNTTNCINEITNSVPNSFEKFIELNKMKLV